jgi:hypothetical protein
MPDSGPQRDARTVSDVLRVLTEFGVDFVVCGGVACIMHGVNRTTAAIDRALAMNDDNLRRFINAVRTLGMQPRIPEPLDALLDARKRSEWIEKKNALVYTVVSAHHPRQIDVFLEYPIAFDHLKRDANVMQGGDVRVLVSSKAHLIAAKRQAGREQDLRDIHDLEGLLRDEAPGQSGR